MIVTTANHQRARQILREWRKRGVAFVRIYHGNNEQIENGYGCAPTSSSVPVDEDDKIFNIPSVEELPESDSQVNDQTPISKAENWVAAAISDFWDDPSVTR
jgi:hypothetical protein